MVSTCFQIKIFSVKTKKYYRPKLVLTIRAWPN